MILRHLQFFHLTQAECFQQRRSRSSRRQRDLVTTPEHAAEGYRVNGDQGQRQIRRRLEREVRLRHGGRENFPPPRQELVVRGAGDLQLASDESRKYPEVRWSRKERRKFANGILAHLFFPRKG